MCVVYRLLNFAWTTRADGRILYIVFLFFSGALQMALCCCGVRACPTRRFHFSLLRCCAETANAASAPPVTCCRASPPGDFVLLCVCVFTVPRWVRQRQRSRSCKCVPPKGPRQQPTRHAQNKYLDVWWKYSASFGVLFQPVLVLFFVVCRRVRVVVGGVVVDSPVDSPVSAVVVVNLTHPITTHPVCPSEPNQIKSAPSLRSRTCRPRTTGSCSPTRSSGSSTTATCTESPSTRYFIRSIYIVYLKWIRDNPLEEVVLLV